MRRKGKKKGKRARVSNKKRKTERKREEEKQMEEEKEKRREGEKADNVITTLKMEKVGGLVAKSMH